MEGFGLIGVATINSAGPVGSSSTANVQRVRVFDVAIANTSGAVGTVRLYDNYASSSTGVTPIIQIDTTDMFLHSDNGYLFANGCYAIATGCTATVNYIREF